MAYWLAGARGRLDSEYRPSIALCGKITPKTKYDTVNANKLVLRKQTINRLVNR